LQFLYQEDFSGGPGEFYGTDLSERFSFFCTLYQVNKKARPYALELLRGVIADIERIDNAIGNAAMRWRLSRIAATDRNLLRIAVYEMMDVGGVPPQVAINEAVEIAKRFGGDDSPKFINGVLDAVWNTLKK